jgi:hypothetical protein
MCVCVCVCVCVSVCARARVCEHEGGCGPLSACKQDGALNGGQARRKRQTTRIALAAACGYIRTTKASERSHEQKFTTTAL